MYKGWSVERLCVNSCLFQLVTLSDYHKELEGIGVNVRAQNFLIFQGTV